MNDDTARLLLEVVARLEREISNRECPAVAALEGDRRLVLTDYDYLRDDAAAAAFEHAAAGHARRIKAVRWVLGVPQVWMISGAEVQARSVSNHPLRPGESAAITWMSCDLSDGVDYGRVPYTRRPNGEPVFDDPELFAIEVSADLAMPGYRLLAEFAEESDSPNPDAET